MSHFYSVAKAILFFTSVAHHDKQSEKSFISVHYLQRCWQHVAFYLLAAQSCDSSSALSVSAELKWRGNHQGGRPVGFVHRLPGTSLHGVIPSCSSVTQKPARHSSRLRASTVTVMADLRINPSHCPLAALFGTSYGGRRMHAAVVT